MQRSGQTAYRCLIPMKDILEDDETKFLFENQPAGFWAPALPAKGVMVVSYPCRNNEILNVVAVHRKLGQHAMSDDDVFIDDWNFPATHEDLERVLDGFHPGVKKLLLKSPEVKVYTQMKREPLNKMTKGKAVLIGDACHPMLLTHAQGVSSSIEDAAALEVFLADVPSSEGVTSSPSEKLLQRLEQFEKFRLPRVCATQIMTDPVVPGPQAAANYARQEVEIRKHYSGPLPPAGAMPHSPAICEFFFGYDVRKEAVSFLDEANDSKKETAGTESQAAKSPQAVQEAVVETTAAVPAQEQFNVQFNEVQAVVPPQVDEKIVVEAAVPVQEQVEERTVETQAAMSDTPTPLEQRLRYLERRLAEMESKLAQLSVHVSTVEIQPTPPQTPPASHEMPSKMLST